MYFIGFTGTKMGYYAALLLLTKAVILLLCCLGNVHGITEYYVKPTEFGNMSCPGEPCHTLNHFASSMHNTWSGVVVRFLPGNHSLSQSLYISSSSNLHLTSFEPATGIQNLSVNIHSPSMANFHFYNVSNIKIDGLSFYNCGINTQGTLYFQNVRNFWVDYIRIHSRTTTDAIQVKNGLGKSVISHSEFSDLHCQHPCIGRVNVHYQNAIGNHLTISKSTFQGSALYITFKNVTSHIEITENTVTSSRWNAIAFIAYQSTAKVHIRNCLLTDSMHSALYFEFISNSLLQLELIIEDSVISDNIVTDDYEGGAGMTVYRETVEKDPIFIIRNVSFLSNKKYGKMHSAIIALYYANHVTFTDCKFHGNIGTAIGAYQSTFYMNGYNSFINNSATKGGAIALLDNSYMFIQRNTAILFQNNCADNVGGAIFAHTTPAFDFLFYVLVNCSVMLLSNDYYSYSGRLTANITLIFTNNTGRNGGDVIYGINQFLCAAKS